MSLSRRIFLQQAAATSLAFGGLAARGLAATNASNVEQAYFNQTNPYGDLIPDPAGLFDLPAGFEYRVLSTVGEEMSDGLLAAGDFDGMGCFAGPDGRLTLVRNHELMPQEIEASAFGVDASRLDRIDRSRIHDWTEAGLPHLGGTSHLIIDPQTLTVERSFMSLAGTANNCAGGVTPWGSWVTCEETELTAGPSAGVDHGYCFEVPASATGLIEPVPLRAMGRFRHEAIAVDPASGAVYQTEDKRGTALFYRYLPDHPGELARGGRLQALAVRGRPGLDLRNLSASADNLRPGEWVEVEWIDMEEVDAPNADLAERGHAAGAARFTRGEGLWWGQGECYFTCTDGGPAGIGQIWRYQPSPHEGQPGERAQPGRLQLFVESGDDRIMEYCDNLCVAPWGDLIVAEDGPRDQYIRGVTPSGEVYTIGRNAFTGPDGEKSEICGPCFSPDGSTLFFNIQRHPGRTFAVRGPWRARG